MLLPFQTSQQQEDEEARDVFCSDGGNIAHAGLRTKSAFGWNDHQGSALPEVLVREYLKKKKCLSKIDNKRGVFIGDISKSEFYECCFFSLLGLSSYSLNCFCSTSLIPVIGAAQVFSMSGVWLVLRKWQSSVVMQPVVLWSDTTGQSTTASPINTPVWTSLRQEFTQRPLSGFSFLGTVHTIYQCDRIRDCIGGTPSKSLPQVPEQEWQGGVTQACV